MSIFSDILTVATTFGWRRLLICEERGNTRHPERLPLLLESWPGIGHRIGIPSWADFRGSECACVCLIKDAYWSSYQSPRDSLKRLADELNQTLM